MPAKLFPAIQHTLPGTFVEGVKAQRAAPFSPVQYDTNDDGFISPEEFRRLCAENQVHTCRAAVRQEGCLVLPCCH